MLFTDLRKVMFTDAEGGGEHHFWRDELGPDGANHPTTSAAQTQQLATNMYPGGGINPQQQPRVTSQIPQAPPPPYAGNPATWTRPPPPLSQQGTIRRDSVGTGAAPAQGASVQRITPLPSMQQWRGGVQPSITPPPAVTSWGGSGQPSNTSSYQGQPANTASYQGLPAATTSYQPPATAMQHLPPNTGNYQPSVNATSQQGNLDQAMVFGHANQPGMSAHQSGMSSGQSGMSSGQPRVLSGQPRRMSADQMGMVAGYSSATQGSVIRKPAPSQIPTHQGLTGQQMQQQQPHPQSQQYPQMQQQIPPQSQIPHQSQIPPHQGRQRNPPGPDLRQQLNEAILLQRQEMQQKLLQQHVLKQQREQMNQQINQQQLNQQQQQINQQHQMNEQQRSQQYQGQAQFQQQQQPQRQQQRNIPPMTAHQMKQLIDQRNQARQEQDQLHATDTMMQQQYPALAGQTNARLTKTQTPANFIPQPRPDEILKRLQAQDSSQMGMAHLVGYNPQAMPPRSSPHLMTAGVPVYANSQMPAQIEPQPNPAMNQQSFPTWHTLPTTEACTVIPSRVERPAMPTMDPESEKIKNMFTIKNPNPPNDNETSSMNAQWFRLPTSDASATTGGTICIPQHADLPTRPDASGQNQTSVIGEPTLPPHSVTQNNPQTVPPNQIPDANENLGQSAPNTEQVRSRHSSGVSKTVETQPRPPSNISDPGIPPQPHLISPVRSCHTSGHSDNDVLPLENIHLAKDNAQTVNDTGQNKIPIPPNDINTQDRASNEPFEEGSQDSMVVNFGLDDMRTEKLNELSQYRDSQLDETETEVPLDTSVDSAVGPPSLEHIVDNFERDVHIGPSPDKPPQISPRPKTTEAVKKDTESSMRNSSRLVEDDAVNISATAETEIRAEATITENIDVSDKPVAENRNQIHCKKNIIITKTAMFHSTNKPVSGSNDDDEQSNAGGSDVNGDKRPHSQYSDDDRDSDYLPQSKKSKGGTRRGRGTRGRGVARSRGTSSTGSPRARGRALGRARGSSRARCSRRGKGRGATQSDESYFSVNCGPLKTVIYKSKVGAPVNSESDKRNSVTSQEANIDNANENRNTDPNTNSAEVHAHNSNQNKGTSGDRYIADSASSDATIRTIDDQEKRPNNIMGATISKSFCEVKSMSMDTEINYEKLNAEKKNYEKDMHVERTELSSAQVHHVNETDFSKVMFHRRIIIHLASPKGTYFIMKEILKLCFRPSTETEQKEIIELKKELNMPMLLLDPALEEYDFVTKNLIKRKVLKQEPKKMGIISVADATILYHTHKGYGECRALHIPCIQEVLNASGKSTSDTGIVPSIVTSSPIDIRPATVKQFPTPTKLPPKTSKSPGGHSALKPPGKAERNIFSDVRFSGAVGTTPDKVKQTKRPSSHSPPNRKGETISDAVIINSDSSDSDADSCASDETVAYVDGVPRHTFTPPRLNLSPSIDEMDQDNNRKLCNKHETTTDIGEEKTVGDSMKYSRDDRLNDNNEKQIGKGHEIKTVIKQDIVEMEDSTKHILDDRLNNTNKKTSTASADNVNDRAIDTSDKPVKTNESSKAPVGEMEGGVNERVSEFIDDSGKDLLKTKIVSGIEMRVTIDDGQIPSTSTAGLESSRKPAASSTKSKTMKLKSTANAAALLRASIGARGHDTRPGNGNGSESGADETTDDRDFDLRSLSLLEAEDAEGSILEDERLVREGHRRIDHLIRLANEATDDADIAYVSCVIEDVEKPIEQLESLLYDQFEHRLTLEEAHLDERDRKKAREEKIKMAKEELLEWANPFEASLAKMTEEERRDALAEVEAELAARQDLLDFMQQENDDELAGGAQAVPKSHYPSSK